MVPFLGLCGELLLAGTNTVHIAYTKMKLFDYQKMCLQLAGSVTEAKVFIHELSFLSYFDL